MKLKSLVSITALSLFLGSAAFVCAQDQQEEPKPRPEATKPHQDEAKPPRQDEVKPPKHQEEGKPPRENEVKPPRQEESKPAKQDRAQQSGHNEQHAAGRSGGRIPDDKFRSHFGRQHAFVVNQVQVIEGQPRFQYSGFWFALVDPWPAGWAYTDDCYIDYIDGEYFLFDLLHPGVQVAVLVVM